jgi:hypothetical protein
MMLRTLVLAAGAILTCLGVGLLACGIRAPGWRALIIGVIVLVGTLFERWRYRRIEAPPRGHWRRTGEQFIDPSTGVPVEVMFNPDTGERRYVDARSGEPKDPGAS